MSKTTVDANVDAVLPGTGWPGSPNNVTLQVALDALKDNRVANVVAIDDTDSPYTLLATTGVLLVDTQAGVVTVDLPAAATLDGHMVTIKRMGTGVNAITIDPAAAETIDGGATLATLDAQYDVVTLVCDGTQWLIMNSNIA